MRKTILVMILAGTAMIAPGMASAAHASHGHGWYASGHNVGGLSLSFVVGQPFRGYGAGSYYRFNRPIYYRGAHCTSRCFVRHGVYYHARSCPVARGYYRYHNVRYAPRYVRYYDNGYGYHRHYRHYYRGSYYRGDSCARPYWR